MKINLNLSIGQKIIVVPVPGRHKDSKQKYGRIHSISKFNIVIDYKQYKESFNLADLISGPNKHKLKVWTGITWEEIRGLSIPLNRNYKSKGNSCNGTFGK